MKNENKKARFLHAESREYRGLRSVRTHKALANRIERRTRRLNTKAQLCNVER